ncbi:MAG: filamentous hemagglutinin N-terminal domain-containing protein, partial [Fusobacterium sp. JB019]|nr:filamentous hemagglutinin N-terminal domain-containing protein [Fusobacterium sp. JB019]
MKNKKGEIKNNLIKKLFGLATYSCGIISYAAGVIIDEDALSKHQATIRKTNNNIDQIDIVTPNERGLSHNKFLKFNVNQRGMILNNSSQMTLTDLAGLIYGNPNLNLGKEAKTILSEVTGLTRSEIEGFIEIAGKEAEFILANPNGIYLSNGGFLNTSKVTMTTGKLVDEIAENGGIVFKITDGQVELANGGSINIANVDYFNILSKAAKIGGAIHSGSLNDSSTKEIKILTGSNTFNYETDEYTSEEDATSNYEYGIDASELGAMSAGKITLIATDKGVGVNSKGNLVANSEDLIIDSNGNIILKNAISKKGNFKAKTKGSFTQKGKDALILAEKNLEINAKEKVSFEGNNGYAKGKDNVKISGKELEISNGSSVVAVNKDSSDLQNIEINTEKINIYGSDSNLAAQNNLKINISSLNEDNYITYNNHNTLYNEGTIQGKDIILNSGNIYNKNNILAHENISITSNIINNLGKITSGNRLNIEGNTSLSNEKNAEISSNNYLNISNYNNILNEGNILTNGTLNISNINSILNAYNGKIKSKEETSLSSYFINNQGRFYSEGSINFVSDNIINEGSIYGNNVTLLRKLNGKGSLINKFAGQIISENITNISFDKFISNEGSIKGNGVTINTENVNNDGTIVAGDKSLDIDASKNITNKGTLL